MATNQECKEAAMARLKALALRTPMGRAIHAARERCQDNRIGSTVKAGKTAVVMTIPANNGRCDVVYLSGWLNEDQAIDFLNDMESVAA